MKPLLTLAFSFWFSVAILFPAAAAPTAWEIRAQNAEGELEYDPGTGSITAPRGVIVTYSNIVLTAERVTANADLGEIVAEGAVTIKAADRFWTGDRIRYNFKTGNISSDTFKTGYEPIFIKGEGLAADMSNKVFSATNAVITTDNYEKPGHRLRARQLTFVPGDYVEARDATLFLGPVPVFYFPYYHRSLKRHPNNLEFTPGYRSLYGPYLLSTYNWYWSEQLSGAIHADVRERRGLGVGPDLDYQLGKTFGDGKLSYYYLDDHDPGLDPIGKPIREYRQRLSFTHLANPTSNLTAKIVARYQSDPYIVRDFFESEYRRNVQPNSFAEINQLWSNWSLDAIAQPRLNNFFETIERLPDIKLTGFRQQLGVSPLYYESESSAGYFRRRFASTNTTLVDFAAWRGDTYHQVTLPQTFFGWLNFTPRVGGRFTYYSESEGRGTALDETTRAVFNTGAEVSFKASRVWTGPENRLFDVHELRHIIEPSINYVYVPSPNRRPPELPQFDYEVQTLRLLPIEFPDYNAIDSIDSQNVFRFTLRNKLQTKRAEGVDTLLNWALYTDWRLRPRTNQTTFANIYSDLDFRPRSWITLNSQLRYDLAEEKFLESNHRLVLQPNNVWSVSLGHRYLGPDPALGPVLGHNLITSSIYYRFNENWGARVSHHFEARDGVLEEQYYTLYRDLRSWTAALTVRLRENRIGPEDFTVALTFSLKAFPRFALGEDSDRPSRLVGY